MKERAMVFGKGVSLSGVLTEPSTRRPELPVVLFLNAGVLHRIGTCRLHVRLARRLADRGFSSLRFDFSGMGDSLPRKDTLPFEKSSVAEVQEAMGYLGAQRGAKEFVLFGLCSGADAALFTALEEPRAVGLVQIDAFSYRTPRWYLHHYGPRLLNPESWRSAVAHPARTLKLLLRPGRQPGDEPESNEDPDVPQYVRVYPPRAWMSEALRKLVARDVRQYYVYTDGVYDHYNYAEQFMDSNRDIDLRGTVKVDHLPDCDHLITAPAHQDHLLRSMTDWMTAQFGDRGKSVAPAKADQPGGAQGPRAA